MRVAYVRVSTAEQNEERQLKALEHFGIERWYTEKVSGKNTNRPKLQEMLDFVREGDVVYVHGMGAGLRSYGLLDLRSSERFIPDAYKYNKAEVRRDVLRGLMDTDGEVNKAGSLIYSTTSRQLADDVMWIARSLGGKARMQPTNKQGWYYKDGKRVDCRDCYRITMTLPFNPFSIKHRKERYKADIQHRYRARYIASIEPIGEYDGMCITVDNKDGLYQARDFIVTHNSAIVSWIIIWAMATHEDTRGVGVDLDLAVGVAKDIRRVVVVSDDAQRAVVAGRLCFGNNAGRQAGEQRRRDQ